MWTNGSNAVMKFWEWIKSILNIYKYLAKITKTITKRKKQKIRRNSCKRYYIQGKRGSHSLVATKRQPSPNILLYLICITASNETRHWKMFESDSFIIGVNNHSYNTISNQRYHFISNFCPLTHQHIKGISGQIFIIGQVTVIWKIEDDEGRVHTL